jgi:HK97 family phage major capsid protein
MTEDVMKMRQERARLWEACKKIHEVAQKEERDLTGEEQEKWDRQCAEIDSLKAKIDRQERHDAIEAELSEKAAGDASRVEKAWRDRLKASKGDYQRELNRPDRPTTEDQNRAFQGWCLRQCNVETKREHEEAAAKCGFNLDQEIYEIRLQPDYDQIRREVRMNTTATTGGDVIPEGFVNSLERSLLYYGGMRQVSTVIRTATGNDLPWPTTDDTSNTGAIVVESANASVDDIATSAVTFNAYKYTSKIIKVTSELLQDSAFNLAAILGSMLGERIGRITNANFTTGTGSAQPKGIVVCASAGVTHDISSGTLSDDIIDLVHSVDPAYRGQPGTGFMMHDTSVAKVRKLKDSNNQYLWQPGMQLGVPDRLFGYPVTINQDMAYSWSATDDPIIFGALRKYVIRDAGPIRLRRLVELYAVSDHEGFVAFSRHDGDMLDAGTDPVKRMETQA